MKEKKGVANDVALLLQSKGYSGEFIQVFFQLNDDQKWDYTDSSIWNDKLHDYMRKYNHGVIDAALKEYRKDCGY